MESGFNILRENSGAKSSSLKESKTTALPNHRVNLAGQNGTPDKLPATFDEKDV